MKLFIERVPDDDVFQSLTAAMTRQDSPSTEVPFSQSLLAADWQQKTDLDREALADESARPDPEQGLFHAKKSPVRPAKASGF